MLSKRRVAQLVAEFMGVIVLATAVYSVVRWQLPSMFVALTAGVVLAVLVNTIGSTSGSHVNPAITLGLWSVRKISTVKAIFYVAVQLLGGLATLALIKYLSGAPLESTAGAFEWKVLVAEGLGALIFGFGVASAVYQKMEKQQLAATVGFSLAVGIMIAGIASNGILNPAVAIGLKSWSWAYAVGPVLGSIIGMNLYALLFTNSSPISNVSMPSINRPKTTSSRSKATAAKKKPAKKK